MDLIFCYILTDWESFVYNDQIFKNVLFNKNFYISNRKYYLADIEYHNIN